MKQQSQQQQQEGGTSGGGQQQPQPAPQVMQRFQQQMQAQYRQQIMQNQQTQQQPQHNPFSGGGAPHQQQTLQASGTGGLQPQQFMATMQQQLAAQQQQNNAAAANNNSGNTNNAFSSMFQQQHGGMNHQHSASSLASSTQQQPPSNNHNSAATLNNNNNNATTTAAGGGGGMMVQPAQQQQNAFLAAANWGMGAPPQQQPTGVAAQRQPSNAMMDASSGSSARLMAAFGGGGGGGVPGANNINNNSALQNMQAVLMQQRVAAQQQQQNQGGMASGGFSASNLNAVQQAALQGTIQGMPGASDAAAMTPQQQLLLAAMQQQLMMSAGAGGGNGLGASGSTAANAALAAMQSTLKQQQQGNNLALQQGQNSSQSILQARQQQQQLFQQMQQMQQQQQRQRGSQGGGSSISAANAASNGMLLQQPQQSARGNLGLAQQMASNMGIMQPQPQLAGGVGQSTAGGQSQSTNAAAVAMLSANFHHQQQANNMATGSQHAASGMMAGRSSSAASNGEQPSRLHSLMHQSSTHSSASNLQQQQQPSQQSVSGNNSVASGNPESNAAPASSEQRPFLDGRFVGGWQSNADLPDRRLVIVKIRELIRQMDTSRLSNNRQAQMAKSLEEHLYRSANSKVEYMDLSTLKRRLQAVAHSLEVHRTSDSGTNSEAGSVHGSQVAGQQVRNPSWLGAPAVQSNSAGNPHNLGSLAAQLGSAGNMAAQLSSSSSVQQQHSSAMAQGINSNPLGGQMSASTSSAPPFSAGQSGGGGYSHGVAQQNQVSGSTIQSQNMNFGAMSSQQQSSQSQTSGAQTSAPMLQDSMSDQKKRVILQQQQRLLLLRHASKCKAGPSCTTKFCDQMIKLWKHMKSCSDRNCKTSHCLSSRCVLNHYRICKSNGRTMSCEVCGPVIYKIKQQERDDGSPHHDPLVRDQDVTLPVQNPEIPAVVSTGSSNQQQPQDTSELAQLLQLQAQESKLKAQLDNLKLLEKKQEQLLEQQKNLEEQARNINDPSSALGRQLQEQHMLLHQLQKRYQQQQLLVQQELQMQTPLIGGGAPISQQTSSSIHDGVVNDTAQEAHLSPQAQRRGSGIGQKRIGSKALTAALSSSELKVQPAEKKKRGSVASKTDFSAKKHKIAKASTVGKKGSENLVVELALSPLLCMTKEEIQKHLESLNKRIVLSSRTVTHKCRPILQEIMEHQFGWVFKDPVDPVALGLPDYFDVIKNPMHLELVKKKLENAIYSDMEGFARDTRLVFENAILYNGEGSEVGELAQSMLSIFEKLFRAVVKDIETSHLHLESQGELCSLCGEQKRRFEPTVLYCQGTCGMQRIKRNASYYTDRTKQNHWCDACFSEKKANDPIHLDDGNEIYKKDLQEFKNDALPEEGWVNCDDCQSWVHQICSLFNGRTNKSTARFTCPACYVNKPIPEGARAASKAVKGAQDLPRCKMSDAIEDGMKEALQTAYRKRASELGVTVDEVEKAEGLAVRVVSNVDKRHMVGDKMLERYTAEDCPSEFPVRTKCIALFQRIHGVDTFLFSMYVYEYGHDCPSPNKRRVYISYLDSVQYFEPKCYRTVAYHSIIIEYLRFVKKRGFHTAHIWSCPPTPGDDYIFYCHPKHQLVPREDMLRTWYHKMLDRAKAQGVVIRTTTLYDEYFTDDSVDPVPCQRRYPTCLPYFEGDYIPGEIENIIQSIGTGAMKPTSDVASLPRDDVMRRIGHNLRKMKDNFIVVHLRNRRFAAAVERGEDVSNWKEDSDDEIVRSKRAKITGKAATEPSSSPSSKNLVIASKMGGTAIVAATPAPGLDMDEQPSASPGAESPGASGVGGVDVDADSKEKSSDGVPGSSAVTSTVSISGETSESKGENTESDALKATEAVEPKDSAETTGGLDDKKSEAGNDPAACTTARLEEESKEKGDGKLNSVETAVKTSSEAASGNADEMNVDVLASVAKADQQQDAPAEHATTTTAAILVEATKMGEEITATASEKAATASEKALPPLEKSAEDEMNVDVPASVAKADQQQEAPTENATTTTAAKLGEATKMGEAIAATASEKPLPPPEKSAEARAEESSLPKSWLAQPKDLESLSAEAPAEESSLLKSSLVQPKDLERLAPILSRALGKTQRSSIPVADTTDEDPPQESEMFESRQQFLNYCQTTHCQFDELRRAKHSTVMVLFQLHNPTAPKFLQQCGACYRDITHGIRYHCNQCSNFSLCEECYEPVTSGLWAKRDARFAHDKKHRFTPIDMEVTEETQKSRAERQRTLKAHVELLEHAGACPGAPGCALQNCQRLKKLFLHVSACTVKPKRDCKICTRLLALCTMHARMCTARGSCPIPFCDRIRERNKRLRRQQQMMDDRRRQAQNELYHAG